jgi:hypothetical protein
MSEARPRAREGARGRVVIDVRQVVRGADGELLADQHVRHVYTLRDGLIARMEIEL